MSEMSEERKRILVVDDDARIRSLFSNILGRAGYVVETAGTGKEALEKIRKENPNVLLLDVQLPDSNGIELLTTSDNHETVKIIVTGFSTEEVGKKAADYGADDFLVKPVKAEELIATVRDRLETKEIESQI